MCMFNQSVEQSKLDAFFSYIEWPLVEDCANLQDSHVLLVDVLKKSDTNIHSKTDQVEGKDEHEVEDLLCSNSDSTLNPRSRGSSSTTSSYSDMCSSTSTGRPALTNICICYLWSVHSG